ncbi:hypothetical protein [Candidatus Nitrospira bockiana]
MAWMVLTSAAAIFGMFVLIFAEPRKGTYQTFGSVVLNAPEPEADTHEETRRLAA